jgi:hypothetical protein
MKKNEKIINPYTNFEGYEDARKMKSEKSSKPATAKAVKAAINRINPDENNQERG